MTFTDFTIRARDVKKNAFLVEVLTSPVGRMRTPEKVTFTSDALKQIDELRMTKKRWLMSQTHLMDLGGKLAEWLLPGESRAQPLPRTGHDGSPAPPAPSPPHV